MAENRLSERLRRSILLYSIISGLLIATVVAIVSMVPLYRIMHTQRENKLLLVLNTRAAAVETFLWEAREVAQQIASRTYLRENLDHLLDDPRDTGPAIDRIRRSLLDAASNAPNVVSAYCFDSKGIPLTHVGHTLPHSTQKWLREHLDTLEDVQTVLVQNEYCLLYRIGIRNRSDDLLGVLVLLYNFETLRQRLSLLPDVGAHEDTFVGSTKSGRPQVFLEMRGREREQHPALPTARILEALSRTAKDQRGILEEDETLTEAELFAYRPISGTDWGIAIRQSHRTLLADIDEQVLRIGSIIFLLIFVIGVGMFLLLRPLAGKLVMHSHDLEERVEEQTADLNAERQRLLGLTEELQEQKRQLEAANEDLDAFSRTVAHDLRTPLVTIQGFADLLLDTEHIKADPESHDMLARVAAKSRLMADQIKALLFYARAGKAQLNRKQINLSALAEEVAADLQEEYSTPPVALRVQPGLQAWADEALLYNVMENLLGNAWKYTSRTEDPRVEVAQEERDGETVTVVRDNGAGFDMMFAERLFQPFQRLHSDSDFAGTGIGLSTVKRIVEQHGGRIWAEGKLGGGAAFYFTLPDAPATT